MIGSALIDTETFHLVWLKIVSRPYPNWTYRVASPVDFGKVMVEVPVGCSDLFSSIDWFYWSKISFKFFVQSFFLNCVYHIYWISVYWSWNLSSNVLKNCLWDISKPDISILFPRRFVGGHGKGAGFCDFTCIHQYIDCLQGSSSSLTIFGGLLEIDL